MANQAHDVCPVETLAREAARIIRMMKKCDGDALPSPLDKEEYTAKYARKLLYNRLIATRRLAATLAARSPVGAAFQLLLSFEDIIYSADVEDMRPSLEEALKGDPAMQIDERAVRMDFLLNNALALLAPSDPDLEAIAEWQETQSHRFAAALEELTRAA